jgi:hypothetical protein
MTDEDDLPQKSDRIWEPIEAEGFFATDDQAEPILHAASAPDAVPGLRSSTEPSDPLEKEGDAPLPSMSRESRGRLTRTAPIFFFFMFSMSIAFLIGVFVGGSRTASLPTQPLPAEVSVPALLLPREVTPTPDSSTAGNSSPQPATSQPHPAPSSSATALRESTPAASDAVPPSPPASEQPAVVVGAPTAPAEPLTEPPMPPEAVAPTPSPIAPAQAPAAVPTRPGLSDIQRQVLVSRGDAFLSAGDVTSARFFYQRGADAGDDAAALRLGETFDAAFLERAHLGHLPGDLKKAIFWYRQARDLGNAEAEILLMSLHAN